MTYLIFTLQSKKSALIGAVKVARKQGMIAAYLNVAAIVAALVVACLAMGLVLGLYGPLYARAQYCYIYRYGCRYSDIKFRVSINARVIQ